MQRIQLGMNIKLVEQVLREHNYMFICNKNKTYIEVNNIRLDFTDEKLSWISLMTA